MGFAPIPFRQFKQLVESHGCTVCQTKKEWIVLNENGAIVSTFSITHGKRTKGNEVKQIYKMKFLQGLMLLRDSEEEG